MRRNILVVAAALVVSLGLPTAASAAPVGDCVDPPPVTDPFHYACVSIDPETTAVDVMVTFNGTKYSVARDENGDEWVCYHGSAGTDCIIEPE